MRISISIDQETKQILDKAVNKSQFIRFAVLYLNEKLEKDSSLKSLLLKKEALDEKDLLDIEKKSAVKIDENFLPDSDEGEEEEEKDLLKNIEERLRK